MQGSPEQKYEKSKAMGQSQVHLGGEQGMYTSRNTDLTPSAIAQKETGTLQCAAGQVFRTAGESRNHDGRVAYTNALNCDEYRLKVPACQRNVAVWVYDSVCSFMHNI